MTTLKVIDTKYDSDNPDVICSNCNMVFFIVWHRNAEYDSIEYCPFCGEEIEEIVDEN